MIDWTVCKGCECFDDDMKDYKCLGRVFPSYKDEKCPCLNCLIKMHCTSACPAFFNYSDKTESLYNELPL